VQLKTTHIVLLGVAAFLLFGKSFQQKLLDKLATFIPSVEGFRSTPYWDVSRYSWGYGTAAPGATGTITRAQAFEDMIAYLLADYNTLRARITRSLSVNQWAALLSFSYNLGVGDGLKIVDTINSGDDTKLGTRWNSFINSGGSVNQDLVKRRAKEWDLWQS
jgi:lysozyme